MLKQRLVVGPLLAIAALLIFMADDWLGRVPAPSWWLDDRETLPGGLLLFAMCFLIVALAAREFSRIFDANGIPNRPWLTTLGPMLAIILSFAIPTKLNTPIEIATAIAMIPTGMAALLIIAVFTFSRKQNVEGIVAGVGGVIFVTVYLGLMLGFYLALRRWHSAWWIVGIVAATKMCDTGAYFTGRAIGRHKLIPWLSPGKTWEGLIGGVIVAGLTGLFMAWLSGFLPESRDHVALWLGAVCGVVFGIVGQGGDLTMSLFKRDAGLKDSSNILPGMGGVMDVLDSPLLVAPVAFWMLILLT
ncbi:MAG: phosphatidate cytidylyltransferase [Phycisphaerales bacterium]